MSGRLIRFLGRLVGIWHVFFDLAYGLSFDRAEELVTQKLTEPTVQLFQAPGGALNHPDTIQNLAFAGKSYGGGAIKVEPRQLDNLEIPAAVLRETGLKSPEVATELILLEHASGKKRDKSGKKSAPKRRETNGKRYQREGQKK